MSRRRRAAQRGFTLMELLVAMAIFAIVGTLALSGYTELQRQSEYAEQRLARMREVQRAVQTHRPGPRADSSRDRSASRSAKRACRRCSPATRVEHRLEFTRAGWSNTAGLRAADAAARGLSARPGRTVARPLAGARPHAGAANRVRAEAARRRAQRALPLHEREPRVGRALAGSRRRGRMPTAARCPAAVEVILDLEDWGEIRRVIEVAG